MLVDSLVFGLIAWGLYGFIARQKGFSRPEDVTKRPRWLFALLLALVFFLAFTQPLTGSVRNSDYVNELPFRAMLFILYSLLPIFAYCLYRLKIWLAEKSQLSKASAGYSKQAAENIKASPDDAGFYLQATDEVDGNKQPALWAKAVASCNGDEDKARYKYINMRVQNLMEEELTAAGVISAARKHEHEETVVNENYLQELEGTLKLAETNIRGVKNGKRR